MKYRQLDTDALYIPIDSHYHARKYFGERQENLTDVNSPIVEIHNFENLALVLIIYIHLININLMITITS